MNGTTTIGRPRWIGAAIVVAVVAAATIAIGQPATAHAQVRLPFGLSFGLTSGAAETQLRARGVVVRRGEREFRTSAAGQRFSRRVLRAKPASGTVRGLRLYFVEDRLVRAEIFGRDRRQIPAWASRLGKPDLQAGEQKLAWLDRRRLQWVRCKPGKCEAVAMSVLVGPAATPDEARRSFERMARWTRSLRSGRE